jgi:hypothetical protein
MPLTLDTIPPELRLEIFERNLIVPVIKLCNPHDTGVLFNYEEPVDGCRVKMPPNFLALLSVCRLFHNEAPNVLFGGNTFVAGQHRKCTNRFMAQLEPLYIGLLKKMAFHYLDNHNVSNGRALIERAPNLTEIDLGGYCILPKNEAAAWKRVVKPGQIVLRNSPIYKRFPEFNKAQMYRFHLRGTLITATMKVTSEDDEVRMRSSFIHARSLNVII